MMGHHGEHEHIEIAYLSAPEWPGVTCHAGVALVHACEAQPDLSHQYEYPASR